LAPIPISTGDIGGLGKCEVSAVGYHWLVMDPLSVSVRTIAVAVADIRHALGWTQAELGRRADVSQAFVSMVENMRVSDLTLETATRLLAVMGARLTVGVSAPFLGDRELQRDPAHARCASYAAGRLSRAGWTTATEVEVGGDRSRGWIDVLAYEPRLRLLLVIEIKTEIRDLGAIERTLGWYEREAWAAAGRLGWRPERVLGCLFLLATDANDTRIGDNLAAFTRGFPIRAGLLRQIMGDEVAAKPGERAIAMIDPRSRRQDWLRPSRFDGRPTPAPYVDYADFIRVVSQRRRRPAA
jgi:transcriptional regulator with XRE-family HTH domain